MQVASEEEAPRENTSKRYSSKKPHGVAVATSDHVAGATNEEHAHEDDDHDHEDAAHEYGGPEFGPQDDSKADFSRQDITYSQRFPGMQTHIFMRIRTCIFVCVDVCIY